MAAMRAPGDLQTGVELLDLLATTRFAAEIVSSGFAPNL
jgi:hypothetical protein